MSQEDDIASIAGSLQLGRSVVVTLATSAALAIVCVGGLWFFGALGTGVLADLLAIGLCTGAAIGARHSWRSSVARLRQEAGEVRRIFTENPERVLWIFPQVERERFLGRAIGHGHSISVCTDDGTVHRLRGIAASRMPDVESAMLRLAPRAFFGLSEKNRRRFEWRTHVKVQ